MARKVRMAMIGGGAESSIGPLHALAADLSGAIDLVAGVFSSNAARGRQAGERYGVEGSRCYGSPEEMLAAERQRPDPIDFVSIVTPNHLHLPAALTAIAAGVHVLCDKPPTATLAEALAIEQALAGGRSLYALTFTYTGFPMVREARARIAAGEIGQPRKVVVNYAQDWLATAVEKTGHAGAEWRTDPGRSGVGGCSADIGTHAFNLAEYVSGLEAVEICADVTPLVEGRALDDDCNALLHFANGAVGVLATTQVAFGERSTVSIAVYGDKGAVTWRADRADELRVARGDAVEILRYHIGDTPVRYPQPRGLGTGIMGPFTLIYADFAQAINGTPSLIGAELPGIAAGIRSMRFVETAVRSSGARRGWQTLAG